MRHLFKVYGMFEGTFVGSSWKFEIIKPHCKTSEGFVFNDFGSKNIEIIVSTFGGKILVEYIGDGFDIKGVRKKIEIKFLKNGFIRDYSFYAGLEDIIIDKDAWNFKIEKRSEIYSANVGIGKHIKIVYKKEFSHNKFFAIIEGDLVT